MPIDLYGDRLRVRLRSGDLTTELAARPNNPDYGKASLSAVLAAK
jgi:hypothetical protein